MRFGSGKCRRSWERRFSRRRAIFVTSRRISAAGMSGNQVPLIETAPILSRGKIEVKKSLAEQLKEGRLLLEGKAPGRHGPAVDLPRRCRFREIFCSSSNIHAPSTSSHVEGEDVGRHFVFVKTATADRTPRRNPLPRIPDRLRQEIRPCLSMRFYKYGNEFRFLR
jgi:hypothetical protein